MQTQNVHMSDTLGLPLSRAYSMFGVRLAIHTDSPAVLDETDLRLCGFQDDAAIAANEIRFDFVTGPAGTAEPPQAADRPVYDTPFGSLYYRADGDILYGSFGGSTMRCEPAAGSCTIRSRRFAGQDLYLATHPLATVALMELMERRGRFSLHAACLAAGSDPDAPGVLIAGPSGAGKSTLTLALARAGLALLSDDVVFLDQPETGGVRGLGFADALGVSGYAVERFPDLGAHASGALREGFPKPLVRPEAIFGPPAARCRPCAIVFPEVAGDSESAIMPIDPGEALLRLVPDVLLTDQASTQAHLAAIAALLEQADCHALRSGRDLECAAGLVADLL